jgi:hypothetical protein
MVWVGEYQLVQAKLNRLGRQVEEGAITMRVAGTYPPERAGEAQARLEVGGTRGGLVAQFASRGPDTARTTGDTPQTLEGTTAHRKPAVPVGRARVIRRGYRTVSCAPGVRWVASGRGRQPRIRAIWHVLTTGGWRPDAACQDSGPWPPCP